MDLKDLKKGAANVAYQLKKNFPENESPVAHFVCENQVVVMSTKKLYVFYCDLFTDYKQEKFVDVVIKNIDLEQNKCSLRIEGRTFEVQFPGLENFENFLKYFEKYKNKIVDI